MKPRKLRSVERPPVFCRFKPAEIPQHTLSNVILSLDEYEAIRLVDYMGLEHLEAAQRMDISRPTFTRLVERARQKIAEFIIDGKALVIEGGHIHFSGNVVKCLNCGCSINIDFNAKVKRCPACNSDNLSDQASQFGHGAHCCHRRRGKRNQRR